MKFVNKILMIVLVGVFSIVLFGGVVFAQPASLSFAAVGDPHYGWAADPYAGDIVNAWMTDRNFPDIDFAINMGDFVSGDFAKDEDAMEKMWRDAMDDSFNNLLLPWMFIFGNHDVQESSIEIEKDKELKSDERVRIGKRETGTMQRCFAFMWDNILFIANGWKGESKGSGMSSDMKARIEFLTDLYPNNKTIILSHGGPLTEDKEWWGSFVDNHPQIVLFIHGHHHNFRHYKFHSVDVIDCGLTNSASKGHPWTVYFEITEEAIRARFYDVHEHTWVPEIPKFEKVMDTGVKDTGLEWYSISKFVYDGQTFTYDNRVLAENVQLQLIGSNFELTEQNVLWDRLLDTTRSDTTETNDFWVNINEEYYFYPGTLTEKESCLFVLNPTLIKNKLQFNVGISGSKTGFIRVIYEEPILWSDDISIGINELCFEENTYNCHFEVVSKYAPDNISLCPLMDSVDVEAAKSVKVKNYYTAYTVDKSKIPGDYNIHTVSPISTPPIPAPSIFPSKVVIEGLEVPETVETFMPFEVSVTVKNEGGDCGIKIGLYVNGKLTDSKIVILETGEREKISFSLELDEPIDYEITIGSLSPKTIKVTAGAPF